MIVVELVIELVAGKGVSKLLYVHGRVNFAHPRPEDALDLFHHPVELSVISLLLVVDILVVLLLYDLEPRQAYSSPREVPVELSPKIKFILFG